MRAHVNNPMKRTATLCIWCCPKIDDEIHRIKRTKSRRVPRIERHTTINLQPTNKAQTATAPETNLVNTHRDATYFEVPHRDKRSHAALRPRHELWEKMVHNATCREPDTEFSRHESAVTEVESHLPKSRSAEQHQKTAVLAAITVQNVHH